MEATYREAARVLRGWTSGRERQVLVWMAARLPAAVHSDHLTLLGAVAMAGAAAAYAAARDWPAALHLANLGLALNWLGDSLDGTLARVRRQERPRYGFYVDHVLDCAGTALLLVGMALSGLLTPILALGALTAYLLVSIETYLATYCLATFRMSVAGIGPTELRLLLIAGNLLVLARPGAAPLGPGWRPFDLAALVAILVLSLIFVTAAIRNGRGLRRDDRGPQIAQKRDCPDNR